MNLPPAGEPAARTRPGAANIAALRLHRQGLIAEQRRCAHLRRLLRARLDLTIVETMAVPVSGCTRPRARATASTGAPLWGQDPPSTSEILVLVAGSARTRDEAGDPVDLVGRLQELEVALRRLSMYADTLLRDIEDITVCFVRALATDPASCLHHATTASLTTTAGVAAGS